LCGEENKIQKTETKGEKK